MHGTEKVCGAPGAAQSGIHVSRQKEESVTEVGACDAARSENDEVAGGKENKRVEREGTDLRIAQSLCAIERTHCMWRWVDEHALT